MQNILLILFFILFFNTIKGQENFRSSDHESILKIIQNDSFNDEHSLEEKKRLSEELYKTSAAENDYLKKLISIDYLAQYYKDKGNVEKFRTLSEEGYSISIKNNNESYKNKFALKIGNFNHMIGNVEKADSIYMAVIAHLKNSSEEKHLSLISFAYSYLYLNQLKIKSSKIDLMKDYVNLSVKFAEKITTDQHLKNEATLNAYLNRVSYLIKIRDFEKSNYLLEITDSLSKNNTSENYRINFLIQSGSFKMHNGQYELSKEVLYEAKKVAEAKLAIYLLKDIHKTLYLCNKLDANTALALMHLEKYKFIADSLKNIEKNAAVNSTKEAQLIKRIKTENKNRILIILIIIISLLFLLVLIMLILKLRIKERKKEEPVMVSQKSTQELYQIAIEQSEVFFNVYIEANPEFYAKLKNKNLNNSEIEICALIKLNISPKKISQIKKSTIRSVESIKYRISKKLELMPNEKIFSWLKNNT